MKRWGAWLIVSLCACVAQQRPARAPGTLAGIKVAVLAGPYKQRGTFESGCPGTGEGFAEEVAAELTRRGVRIVTTPANADVLLKSSVGNDAQPRAQAIVADEQVGAVTVNPCDASALVDEVMKEELLERAAKLVSKKVAAAPPPPPSAVAATPTGTAASPAEVRPAGSAPQRWTSANPQAAAYAVVIGIERYRDVPPASGARRDAERVAEMLENTLGLTSEHVRLLVDDRATRGDFETSLEWLKTSVPAGGRIYFYFAGHGSPDPTRGTSFLMPYDGNAKYLDRSAMPLASVLDELGRTNAREVLAVVDACFSGAGGRSVLAEGTRPLVRMKETPVASRVVLLSASTGEQISGPAPSADGGLFTSHFLEAVGRGAADMNGDGQISVRELTDWIGPRVARDAKRENRDQTPNLSVGSGVDAGTWMVGWGYPVK